MYDFQFYDEARAFFHTIKQEARRRGLPAPVSEDLSPFGCHERHCTLTTEDDYWVIYLTAASDELRWLTVLERSGRRPPAGVLERRAWLTLRDTSLWRRRSAPTMVASWVENVADLVVRPERLSRSSAWKLLGEYYYQTSRVVAALAELPDDASRKRKLREASIWYNERITLPSPDAQPVLYEIVEALHRAQAAATELSLGDHAFSTRSRRLSAAMIGETLGSLLVRGWIPVSDEIPTPVKTYREDDSYAVLRSVGYCIPFSAKALREVGL